MLTYAFVVQYSISNARAPLLTIFFIALFFCSLKDAWVGLALQCHFFTRYESLVAVVNNICI